MKPVIRIVATALVLLLAGCTLGPSLPDGARLEERVTYVERDQGPLAGRLFVPPGEGPHPAVLLVHGGGWRGGSPWHMDHIGRLLAREGFLAFSPGYRFAPDAVHPAQLVDIREAWNWLAQRDDVQPRNMAVWGYSAGAHLALLLGLAPEAEGGPADGPRPIAVIGGGSPARLALFEPDGRLLVNLLGGTREEMPQRWESASPITWVTPDDPPVYLYHGSDDDVVSPEHAEALASALQDAGVPVVLDRVPGGHISVALLDRDVERRAAGFIRQQMRDAEGMFDDDPVHGDPAP